MNIVDSPPASVAGIVALVLPRAGAGQLLFGAAARHALPLTGGGLGGGGVVACDPAAAAAAALGGGGRLTAGQLQQGLGQLQLCVGLGRVVMVVVVVVVVVTGAAVLVLVVGLAVVAGAVVQAGVGAGRLLQARRGGHGGRGGSGSGGRQGHLAVGGAQGGPPAVLPRATVGRGLGEETRKRKKKRW